MEMPSYLLPAPLLDLTPEKRAAFEALSNLSPDSRLGRRISRSWLKSTGTITRSYRNWPQLTRMAIRGLKHGSVDP